MEEIYLHHNKVLRMRYLLSGLLLVWSLLSVKAQGELPQEAAEAVRIGKLLYRSEVASWHGTDILMQHHRDLMPLIGGYFSYADGERTICLFFSKDADPTALVRFVFDQSLESSAADTDTARSPLTEVEQALFSIRQSAMDLVRTDDMFKFYERMNFNLIPVIDGKQRQVYILSGPKESGLVVLGNDYLITFDKSNKVKEKRSLHKNILTFEEPEEDIEVSTTMHSHLPETGDFITATDICTLMLYAGTAGWPQHIVMSRSHVSIWDCKKQDLMVMDRAVWEKTYKDQEERHPTER